MRIGICSFSFHRLLAAGKQDIFQYIKDCKDLGCTQLDPWNAHLAPLKEGDTVLHAGKNPNRAELAPGEDDYIARVRAAADEAGLPFGCIAVDGAHIYEPDPAARQANRQLAYRWLQIAHQLGAPQVRIDSGGQEDWPDDVFAVVVEGYNDLIARGRDLGIRILVENHWGPTQKPQNVLRLLDGVDGLGYLFDTHNWKAGLQQEAWQLCAHRADAMHVKTFAFDAQGNEPSVDLSVPLGLLRDCGFDGCWGVESVPRDGQEYEAARKTIALIRRYAGA